ncbi:MAG: 50S ribosomal protein L25 [Anaerolineae bacterium]|nr:MAG: 50S ribosomal protein L25 [Anaerolineae bacterium]
MEKIVLKATKRDVTGKQVRALRRQGKLPAVLYGHNMPSTPITLNAREAAHVLARLPSSSLVTIELDGKEYPALVREKQRDFIKNTLLHVDFLAVTMTERIRATVAIEMVGEAPAVKELGAILVTNLDQLEIECLPGDLPERIVVDISGLTEIGSAVHVRDVEVPEKVDVLTDPDEVIAVITAAREEEVTEEVAVEAEVEEPEVIERGKKEEEEEAESEE